MVLNLLGLAAALFFAYAFFTLFLKSVRSRNWFIKILGGLVTGAIALMFAGFLVVGIYGMWRVSAPRVEAAPAPQVKVQPTPELIARGRTVAQSCIPCHSFDGSAELNGGARNALAASPVPYGFVYPPNLTPAGRIKGWTDGEIIRAVRQGLAKDGEPLFHPASAYAGMSDEDAAALVAYLRSQPELRHDVPSRTVNLAGLIAAGLGWLSPGAWGRCGTG